MCVHIYFHKLICSTYRVWGHRLSKYVYMHVCTYTSIHSIRQTYRRVHTCIHCRSRSPHTCLLHPRTSHSAPIGHISCSEAGLRPRPSLPPRPASEQRQPCLLYTHHGRCHTGPGRRHVRYTLLLVLLLLLLLMLLLFLLLLLLLLLLLMLFILVHYHPFSSLDTPLIGSAPSVNTCNLILRLLIMSFSELCDSKNKLCIYLPDHRWKDTITDRCTRPLSGESDL